MELIWEKKLNDGLTLQEYQRPEQGASLPCTILYEVEGDEDIQSFHFGSWGMNRDEITERAAYVVCQSLLWDNSNTAIAGFKSCLDFYEPNYEEE